MEVIFVVMLSVTFSPISVALTMLEKEHLVFSVNDVKTSYSVTPGSSYTLSCPLNFSEYEASSPSPSSVVWFFNSEKIGSKSDVYSTTALRLHITRVTDSQYGNYTCRFKPFSGTSVTSPPMALTKGSAPSLNKKQRAVDVWEERLTQVQCLGNFGSPKGRVTWFRDNDEILDNEVFSTLPSGDLEVAGLLSSLLFTVSTSTQNFKFHCEVTNEHGKDTSGLLTLKLAQQTESNSVMRRLSSRSRPTEVLQQNEGKNVVLQCGQDVILSKSNVLTWRRIYNTSSSIIDFSFLDGKYSILGQFNLQIDEVEMQDSGFYECAIESEERYVAQQFHLIISEDPKLTNAKMGAHEIKTVTEHDTVSFDCPVSGQPTPPMFWLLNSEPIISDEFTKISQVKTSLTLFGVETKQRGVIQCMAVGYKVWISTFGFLDITPYEEAPVTSDIGMIKSVLAETISSHFIQLTWEVSRSSNSESSFPNSTNNGASHKNIAGFEVRYAATTSASAEKFPKRYKLLKVNSQSASVVVTSLTPNTPHSFIIRAFDETGKTGPFSDVKTVATIAEDLKPGKIEGLQISSIGTRQVTLRWSKIDSRISNLDYEVLYQEENTINGLTHKEIATTEQHLVLGLAEFTRYSFVVRARNEFGFGSHSDAISCETLSDMPSGYPNDIDIITDSTERLVIKWKPPALVDWNGYLTGYSIKFRSANERTAQSRKLFLSEREILSFAAALDMGIEAEESQQRSKFILDGLSADTEYEVAVAAINTNGTGPHCEWTTGRTMDHELSEVTIPGKCDLRVEVITDTAISLSWDPPLNINSTKIRGYQVQCNKLFKLPWDLAETLDNRQFEVTFRNLQPDTTYICALVAYNKSPKMSDVNAVTINVKTKAERARGAPSSAPSNIKVMPLAEDSISIRFDVDRNSAQFFQIRRESRIKPSVDREYQEHDSLYLLNITRNYHHFSNLQPNTQYMFDVRAFNGGKPSSWSAKVSAITQEAVPTDAPQMFEASRGYSKEQPSVLLTWRSPTLPNGRIKGYIISYSQKIGATPWAMEPISGTVFNHTVTKLKPHSVYYFKIQAETSIGGGAWSDIKAVKTALAADKKDAGVFASSENVGLKREHVYIIIAAVIGASLIIICLILAFLVCHVFSKASSKHRLNTIQYTPTSETAGYNGNAHHMIASNAKGPPSNSHFTPTDLQTGFVEVKQIEQDALRKSPAEIMAQQNGVPFNQSPTNDSPSGIRVPMPTPAVAMPQYQSINLGQQDMQFAIPPPPNSSCVTPAAQLPHLGRSAFMTTSPLLKEVPDESGNTLYPKGYHEVPTVQSPTDFNMQFVQPRTGSGFYPHSNGSHVSSAGSHAVTPSASGSNDNRCSTGALINQFVRPSASTVVARSKPPSYPQPIPLNSSSCASTIGIGARSSDDASSDRLTSTATEEDVHQATEKIMELMSRVNQISKNL